MFDFSSVLSGAGGQGAMKGGSGGLSTGASIGKIIVDRQDANASIEATKESVSLNSLSARQAMEQKFLMIHNAAELEFDAGTRQLMENAVTAAENRATAKALAAEAGAEGASTTSLLQSISAKEGRFGGYVRDTRNAARTSAQVEQRAAWLEAMDRIRSFRPAAIRKDNDLGLGFKMASTVFSGFTGAQAQG